MDETEIIRRVGELRQEHRDLDAAIDLLVFAPATDQLQIARFKKRKLQIKDQVAQLEAMLIPDIIA